MTAASAAPTVRRAGLADLETLAALFDAYRRFYEQPADTARARAFLRARLERGESVVFLADASAPPKSVAPAPAPPPAHAPAPPVRPEDGTPPRPGLGFCQLYPTWCSVAAAPIFVLYDLYVVEGARRAGVGRALLLAAEAHARAEGVARMDLSTARDNDRAQRLYESLGWRRDDVFLTYNLDLSAR